MSSAPLDYASPDLRVDGWVTRQLKTAIGWPTHVATIAVFIACLAGSANYIYQFWLAFLGVPALFIWWLFRLGTWESYRPADTPERLSPSLRKWLLLPALAAIAVSLIWFDLPARGLFAVHRGELDRLAKLADASPTPFTWTGPVGLLGNVTVMQLEPGIVGVSVPGMGVTHVDGFVYFATDMSPHLTKPMYGWAGNPLAPRWFKWIRASY